jgi:hypothetical protein
VGSEEAELRSRHTGDINTSCIDNSMSTAERLLHTAHLPDVSFEAGM